MTPALHPAIRADWLVLRRMGWVAAVRTLGAPALLLACCVAVACGDFYTGYGWCLAAAALLALGGSHAIVHERLRDALERWRFGWCGALPIARGTTARTLLLVTAAALVVSLACVVALLVGAATPAPHHGDLPYALAAIALALVAGVAVAAVRVFRPGLLARARQADGIREPLLALPWLNDQRLPHLLDWQRRTALVRWRCGGGALVALVLVAVPDAASIPNVVGLFLLLVPLVWMDVVMRASANATASAVRLLGAAPLDARCARVAALRYPFVAVACALIPMAVGAILGRRGVIVLAWLVCAGAISAWPLIRIFRATRRPAGRA